MFKQQHILKSRLIVTDWLTLGLLCLALMLLTACRSASSTIKVEAEIEPEPIVGEIATLRIEAVSQKFSGDGRITVYPSKNISITEGDLGRVYFSFEPD